LKLARKNERWGYRRIAGELLKLGHQCSHLTVRKVLRRHNLPPAPRRGQRSLREFVRQHADQMLASDFFCVDTVWMTRLYVLFFHRDRHPTRCFAKLDQYVVERTSLCRETAWVLFGWSETSGSVQRKASVKDVGAPGDREGHARIDGGRLETGGTPTVSEMSASVGNAWDVRR